jgi:DHA1 family tetracycline resistance protein-like MFS transporter
MFGIGFIIGPVLGGLLGDIWLRSPFLIAAILNAANFALALFLLPESRPGQKRTRFTWSTLNPFKPLAWALTFKALIPLMAIYLIMNLVGTVYGSIWAIFSEDVFAWNGMMIGLSLGAYGLLHAIAQAFLTGPAVARLGERWALLLGMACEITAMLVMALSGQGWLVFVIMPIFALGGIGMPALQSLLTRQVDSARQGQLQGVLASLVSLASVFGPLFFSMTYHGLRPSWPGAIWLVAICIYLLAVPLMMGIRRTLTVQTVHPG